MATVAKMAAVAVAMPADPVPAGVGGALVGEPVGALVAPARAVASAAAPVDSAPARAPVPTRASRSFPATQLNQAVVPMRKPLALLVAWNVHPVAALPLARVSLAPQVVAPVPVHAEAMAAVTAVTLAATAVCSAAGWQYPLAAAVPVARAMHLGPFEETPVH